jgi:cytochrome c-type biogenesis protein CcmF
VIYFRRKLLQPANKLEVLLGREGMFLAVNVLLVGMMLITLVGTTFPILSSAFGGGKQVTVSASYYNKVVAPMGLVLVALMAVGPLLVYGKTATEELLRKLVSPSIAAATIAAAMFLVGHRSLWAVGATFITALALINILGDVVANIARKISEGENPVIAIVRVLDANHRRYGGMVVHVGMLMIVVGVIGSSVFGVKETYQLHPGQSVVFGGQTLTFVDLNEKKGPNYTAVEATVQLADAAGNSTNYFPQRRFYDKAEDGATEVALQSTWRQDTYLTLSGWEKGGETTAIQAMVNPLVSWIWIGGIVLSVGAVICMLPRFLAERAARPVTAPAGEVNVNLQSA